MIVLLTGCFLIQADHKHRFTTTPEALDDGWTVGDPEDVGLDPNALADIHDALLERDRFVGTLGVLIAKDGVLVFETYLRDPGDRDKVHALMSATKSVTSTAYGIAHDRGLVPGIDAAACDLLDSACDGLADVKYAITVEHLMTMRSGLDLDDSRMSYILWVEQPEDPLNYLLTLPQFADPGETYRYRDVDPQVMAYVLEAQLDQTEEDFVAGAMFDPLGIDDWHWLALHDGATTGAWGLYLRPRDFAKLGQMGLDHGTWNGTEIVSQEWLDLATSVFVSDTGGDSWQYGLNWWVSLEGDAITANGHGGQFAMWVPEAGLLAVQVAMPDAALHGEDPQEFYDLISPLW